ncbi:YeeE/YedE family protein [Flavobacterium sp. DGU11]|uniref:YeeE/YedE family protein n=1 Tax=Flavobacterium arundinis TaxID=3139143 RepID=A0ABU9I201_9FLAO
MSWIYESCPLVCVRSTNCTYHDSTFIAGKNFGMSSNLCTVCAELGAGKNCDFFYFDWRSQRWNLLIMAGAIIGGFIAMHFLSGNPIPDINPEVIVQLRQKRFESAGSSYQPTELFGNGAFSNHSTVAYWRVFGRFGARYSPFMLIDVSYTPQIISTLRFLLFICNLIYAVHLYTQR